MMSRLCETLILINFLIYHLVDASNQQYIESSLRNYFSNTRHHVTNRQYKMAAKEYIYREFTNFGMEVEYFTFDQLSVSTKTNFTSVIGILKGTEFGRISDRLIGIGAHYDTVNSTKGVDDNGSGVVAMLEVARQLLEMNKKGLKRKNTIVFAAIDLEEYGFSGSIHLITSWLNPWLVKNYGSAAEEMVSHGMIILDSIMSYNSSAKSQLRLPGLKSIFPDTYASISSDNWKGDFLAVFYRNPTLDKQLTDVFKTKWKESDETTFELELFGLPYEEFSKLSNNQQKKFFDYMRSDHAVFWEHDIPAILLTDTAIYRNDIRNCYHKLCDNLETILTNDNLQFLGKTADVLTMTVHTLSDPDQGRNEGRKPVQHIITVIIMCLSCYMFSQ